MSHLFDTLWLTSDSLENGDENDGADKRDDKARKVETTDVPTEAKEIEKPASQDRSDDADDDIEENALLRVSIHEE